ncbi:hypothetical protein CTA1_6683 [Colletotrichum tanaceti]|uniref:Ecp2 effector protein domain-containing protein n=1 Tax=Colletotrichum tanaceti TaxID=1306861 RepID=A0A4U6XF59_9PEZI|nr:hypothetical protein CTA1_6683 [Colletotrichum tanaceti]
MRSLSTVFVFMAALAGQSLARSYPENPACNVPCAHVSASADCPQVNGTTKEDADQLDGPKFKWAKGFWSTRGREGAVVEILMNDCTLRTFQGRPTFCGVWIAGKEGREKRRDLTERDDPAENTKVEHALLEIPHEDGCCKIDSGLCENIDWAQLWRIKKQLRPAGGVAAIPPDCSHLVMLSGTKTCLSVRPSVPSGHPTRPETANTNFLDDFSDQQR